MAEPVTDPERPGRSSARSRRGLVENEIYEHATRLFSEKGFASTTLQDIADALGMTRPAVYYYFKTKEEILARLVGRITQDTAADLEEIAGRDEIGPPECLQEITRLHIRRISSQADQFRLLLKSESELRGLVWKLTPKEDISHTDEPGARWYQKPVPLAGVGLATVIVLNLLFW